MDIKQSPFLLQVECADPALFSGVFAFSGVRGLHANFALCNALSRTVIVTVFGMQV